MKNEQTTKQQDQSLSLTESSQTVTEPIMPADFPFNLSDFALFLSVMRNKRAYECTLSIILDEPHIELKEVIVEEVVLNKSGKRAIRLDAWALDTDNQQYNMEMQNNTRQDDMPKRSRFYQSMLDTPILKSGKNTKYRSLPSTVIIFITQDDIFKKDCAKYTFVERCEEVPDLYLEDGTKKIFLNMTSRNGAPELISLLQYMKETNMDNPNIMLKDERIIELDRIVQEIKESEEWEVVKVNILEYGIKKGEEIGIERGMKRGMERGLERGLAQGLEQGLEQGIKILIESYFDDNMPEDFILSKLIKKYQLSDEQAHEYMKKYSQNG